MAEIVRTRTVWTGIVGSPFLTTVYVEGGEETSAQDALDVIDGLYTAWQTFTLPSLLWATENLVDIVDTTTGQIIRQESGDGGEGAGTAGGSDGKYLPEGTQFLVNLPTGVYQGGRQIRGKLYFPGPLESANAASGVPNATITNAMESACQAAALSGMTVWSPTYLQANRPAAVVASRKWARLSTRRS